MDNLPAARTPRPLPKLVELHHDVAKAYKNDEYQLLVHQPPNKTWVKKHPFVKVKNADGKNTALQYIPSPVLEVLLTRIYGFWKWEVLDVKQCANSIITTGRLHYQHPTTGEWMFHDGVGAAPIQQDSGADVTDMAAVKTTGVQMGAPSSNSYAFKNACKHLGPLFGRDLNKNTTLVFKGQYIPFEPTKDEEETTSPPSNGIKPTSIKTKEEAEIDDEDPL